MQIEFHNLSSVRELRTLEHNILRPQDLGYPNYQDWVSRTIHELDIGYKTAILAFFNGTLVGDLIYQPHKTIPRVMEIKNIRVLPRVRLRDFGRFMTRQAEAEIMDSCDAVTCDAPINATGEIKFLISCGYSPKEVVHLYDDNRPDVQMWKNLKKVA